MSWLVGDKIQTVPVNNGSGDGNVIHSLRPVYFGILLNRGHGQIHTHRHIHTILLKLSHVLLLPI